MAVPSNHWIATTQTDDIDDNRIIYIIYHINIYDMISKNIYLYINFKLYMLYIINASFIK